MKLRQLMVLVCATMLLLAGCNYKGDKPGGNTSSSERAPERIISLMPSNTEILYELGVGDRVVGVSTVDDYPKEVQNKKQFDAMNLDKEELIKTQPDLILAHETQKATQGKVLDSLEKSGVNVEYVHDVQSIDEMYDTFHFIGKLVDKKEEADDLVKETQNNIKEIKKTIPETKTSPNVYVEVASNPELYTVGGGTFIDDMLKQINAKNVFHDVEGWPKVSKEQVIKKDPDVMLSIAGTKTEDYQKEVSQRDGFDKVTAVKDDHVKALNDDMLSRPGPRLDEGLQRLRDAIYEKE